MPRHTLLPIIVLFCVIGAYAIGGSYFDVAPDAGDGRARLRCSSAVRFPVGPVVLGIILGGPLEERFVQALTASRGSLSVFVSRPVAAVLALAAVAVWLLPVITAKRTGAASRPLEEAPR